MSHRLLAPRWLGFHALALTLVVIFLRLGWWQLSRAQDGNGLSIGYALEWPLFALFTAGMWWWLCRDAGRRDAARPAAAPVSPHRVPDAQVLPAPPSAPPRPAAAADPALAAYNRMLAQLSERNRR